MHGSPLASASLEVRFTDMSHHTTLLLTFKKYILCIFCLHVCLCSMCMSSDQEDVGPLGTGVTDACGCWELSSGPLEEQPML